MKVRSKLKAALVASAIVVAGAVPVALAQGSGPGLSELTTFDAVQFDDEGSAEDFEGEFNEFDEGFDEDEMDYDEKAELDEMNAFSDELSAHLTELGVDHTMQTAEVRWVEWDESDEAANEAVDSFFEEFDDDFDLEDLTEEDIEEIRAEAEGLKQALDEAGISYQIETDELGIDWPEFDEEDEAAWQVVDEFFDKLDSDFDGEGDDFEDEEDLEGSDS